MRNRHVERSKRTLFFRIFGALVIIILIWVIFFLPDSENEVSVPDTTDTLANDQPTIPAEVSDFVTFVKLSSDTVEAEETRTYASLGIEQLSIALESFVQRNSASYHSMTKQTDELMDIAKDLEKTNGENNSAKTRKAFLIAADLLQNIQGTDESDSVKIKAEGIQEDLDLAKQLENVKSYFFSIANELKQMTGIEDKSML